MDFKARKIIALFLTITNVFLAAFLHGYEYGLIMLAMSLIVLVFYIWFKNFFSTVIGGICRKSPNLLEFIGFAFLFIFLFFTLFAKSI